MKPEEKARKLIDTKLEQSGWIIQDFKQVNPTVGLGVAVREYPTSTGPVDYALFVDGKPVGIIEAKKDDSGENITVVESQSGRYAGLTSVTIGNGVTSIGDAAFADCSGLTNITVSENNSTYASIDGNLYSKDGKTLIQYAIGKTDTSFTIPDSVTSIGDEAFEHCDSLTSVTIPDSVTSIGSWAFEDCSGLKTINYRGTQAQWNAVTTGSSWKPSSANVVCNYTGE